MDKFNFLIFHFNLINKMENCTSLSTLDVKSWTFHLVLPRKCLICNLKPIRRKFYVFFSLIRRSYYICIYIPPIRRKTKILKKKLIL